MLNLIVLLSLFVAFATHVPPYDENKAVVSRIINGDTIEVVISGYYTRIVRYIGIEAVNDKAGGGCGEMHTTDANRHLALHRSVRLVRDISDIDQYGYLLRYVYLDDDRMINEELVGLGYAYARVHPPNIRHQQRLKKAEQAARATGAGLWRICRPQPTPLAVSLRADHAALSASQGVRSPSILRGRLAESDVIAVVKIISLDIRSGPGFDYKVVGEMQRSRRTVVTGRNADGKWVEIYYPWSNGSSGWVYADYLQLDGEVHRLPVRRLSLSR